MLYVHLFVCLWITYNFIVCICWCQYTTHGVDNIKYVNVAVISEMKKQKK
jgi:hypothetical protein